MKRRTSPSPDETPVMPLTLVGCVHGDRQGFRRTLRFLESFRPDLVLVELSPYGRAFRHRHQRTLQQTLTHHLAIAAGKVDLTLKAALLHPEIRAIRRQVALPFEYRAARRFSTAADIPLVLVDYSPFSHRLISQWPELLSAANLSVLLTLPERHRPTPAGTYELAARAIRQDRPSLVRHGEPGSGNLNPLWHKRERFMATRIRSALKRFCPRNAVYLGGWEHLTAGGSFTSLRELLGLDHTSCRLLDRGLLKPH